MIKNNFAKGIPIYKYHNTKFKSGAGFTLVEIIVSISILSIIIALGLFISMDFARSYNFGSERSTIVSVLQKARGESLNNIDQVRHGVHFQANPLKYIIFQCPIATPQCTSYTTLPINLTIGSSYNVSITNPTMPFDVIFDQLSGSCVDSTTFDCTASLPIIVTEGNKSSNININPEGRIDW